MLTRKIFDTGTVGRRRMSRVNTVLKVVRPMRVILILKKWNWRKGSALMMGVLSGIT